MPTYTFSLGFVESCPEHIELIQGLLLGLPHLLHQVFFIANNLVRLLLMLLDNISIVALTLAFELLVLLLEVECVLLIQGHLVQVSLLHLL